MNFTFVFKDKNYIIDSILDFSSTHSISEIPHNTYQITTDQVPVGFLKEVGDHYAVKVIMYDKEEIWRPAIKIKQKYNAEENKMIYVIGISA